VEDFPLASLNVLGGLSSRSEDRDYLIHLKGISQGFNIHFGVNVAQRKLGRLLRTSGLYWHAAGIGVDVVTNPEKCEHFGISIAEAMSAGAVPFAVGTGGATEIIDFAENGFLYHDPKSLLRRTRLFLSIDGAERAEMRKAAKKKAASFGPLEFGSRWSELVK
jgi:O-antigen biosynthesis protein